MPTSLPIFDIEKRLSFDKKKNSKDIELAGKDECDITTSVLTSPPTFEFEKQLPYNERKNSKNVEVFGDDDSNIGVLENEHDIATHVVSIQDNFALNPWTLRAFIIGLGLSAFGAVLGTSICFTKWLLFHIE